MSSAAYAASAANIEVCITNYRIQTSNARHSVSGFGRLRDGRLFAYSIAATDMYGIIGTSSSITPTVAGPGTGCVAGAEPELVRLVERAAMEGAWLRVNLDASAGALQKVSFVGRAYPSSGRCAQRRAASRRVRIWLFLRGAPVETRCAAGGAPPP